MDRMEHNRNGEKNIAHKLKEVKTLKEEDNLVTDIRSGRRMNEHDLRRKTLEIELNSTQFVYWDCGQMIMGSRKRK